MQKAASREGSEVKCNTCKKLCDACNSFSRDILSFIKALKAKLLKRENT